MGAIALWLLDTGVPKRLIYPLIYVVAALGIIGAVALAIHLIRADAVSDDHAKTEARALPASAAAAEARATDAITNAHNEEQAHAVINAAPTGTPLSAPSRALACERLRRAGRVPAACR